MALAPITWVVLILAAISSTTITMFTIIMIRQIFKKRTLGTIFLSATYVFITIGSIMNTCSYWFSTLYTSEQYTFVQYFSIINAISQGLGYYFFYHFANRHILKDNEFVKAIISGIVSISIAFMGVIYLYESILRVANPISYEFVVLEGVSLQAWAPTGAITIPYAIIVLSLTGIRIAFKLGRIQRTFENPVTRIGFRFMFLATISLMLSSFSDALTTIPFIYISPFLITLVLILQYLLQNITLLFGYLGWILPDWLRRRVRGKAWIVKTMKVGKIEEGQPFASNIAIKKTFVEVADK